MIEVTKQVVHASDAGFEEHPESYRPRIFIGVMPPCVYSVYELLSDGNAITWPSLPQKETCGFDFWTIYADSIKDITMMRHDLPASIPQADGGGRTDETRMDSE